MLKLLIKHKKLIIIFLIIVSFLIFVKEKGFKRISENFENINLIDVINGLDVQDQKLNDIITELSATDVTFNKNIITNKNIKAGSKIVLNSNGTIATNKIDINDKISSVGGDSKADLTATDIKKNEIIKKYSRIRN